MGRLVQENLRKEKPLVWKEECICYTKAGLYIERNNDFITVQLTCELVLVKGTAKKLKALSCMARLGEGLHKSSYGQQILSMHLSSISIPRGALIFAKTAIVLSSILSN